MRVVVRALLLAFAFAVPWEYSLDLGAPFGNIARIAGVIVVVAAIPAVLFQGRFRNPGPLQALVLALFLWWCCSAFWTIDQAATLIRLRAYFQVIVPVWLIWEFCDTPMDFRDLLRAYVAGSWVLAILTIANFASLDTAAQVRFAAEGQDPNDVARFLDLGFPLSALLLLAESRRLWRWMALGYLPVGLVGVLLTASRGGFLAALVALCGCGLLMARSHLRTVITGTLSLPFIAAGFWVLVPHETLIRIATIPQQLEHGDLNRRLNIWSAGWQAFRHAPFFGHGAGTFVQAAGMAPIDTAHNTPLTLAVECGIVALILASAVLLSCARSVLATREPVRLALATAFLVWTVTSMAATVETNRTTWLLFGILALAGRLANEQPELMDACFASGSRGAIAAPAGKIA